MDLEVKRHDEISSAFITTDRSYLERLERRDPDTEAHFVSHLSVLLNWKLRSKSKSRQVMDDICQETFSRVFAAIRAGNVIRNPERLGAFASAVCNNIFLEFCRLSSRNADEPVESLPSKSKERNAEELLLQAERDHAVREVLSQLSERDSTCLRALLLDECDKAELCNQLNIDQGYLRVLLHRAKVKFKACYMERSKAQANLSVVN